MISALILPRHPGWGGYLNGWNCAVISALILPRHPGWINAANPVRQCGRGFPKRILLTAHPNSVRERESVTGAHRGHPGSGNSVRERGSVTLVVVGLLVVLLGFLAMALDLSRLYQAREAWQGAIDAAAIAGVRQLDGTLNGTYNAVLTAQQTLNGLNQTGSLLPAINLNTVTFRVGPCSNPDSATSSLQAGLVTALHWSLLSPGCSFQGATNSAASSGVTNPVGLQFLEVDSGSQAGLVPWFAQFLPGWSTQDTLLAPFGYAVAGYASFLPPLLFR